MFGLFNRKKKQLEQMASNICTMLNVIFWPLRKMNDDDLPSGFETDKFLLGYIYGVIVAGGFVYGLKKPVDKGMLTVSVFEMFFPSIGMDIASNCTTWANENNEGFCNGMDLGMDESSIVYKAMMTGDENAVKNTVGALQSLEKHLHENYDKAP